MPRLRVIVLDQPDPRVINVAFWMDVPAARQKFYAKASARSEWIDAQPADVAALQAGQVVEHVVQLAPDQVPSLAQAQTVLAAMWTARQAAVNNRNEWPNYGTTWDGTAWSLATVA